MQTRQVCISALPSSPVFQIFITFQSFLARSSLSFARMQSPIQVTPVPVSEVSPADHPTPWDPEVSPTSEPPQKRARTVRPIPVALDQFRYQGRRPSTLLQHGSGGASSYWSLIASSLRSSLTTSLANTFGISESSSDMRAVVPLAAGHGDRNLKSCTVIPVDNSSSNRSRAPLPSPSNSNTMSPSPSAATVTACRPLSIPPVKMVSPEEMDGHFQLVKELGSGSFGVALLINVLTSPEAAPLVPLGCEQVVFKKLRPDIPANRRSKVARDLAAEGIILRQLDGLQGVPRLYGITSLISSLQPIIVQEYIPGPSLIRFLNVKLAGQPRSIRRRFFWKFARSLLRVIHGLHRRHIVHGDIKTDNIILRQPPQFSAPDPLHLRNPDVHLIDFGLSLIVEPHTYDWQAAQQLPLCFSQWHSSPEQIKAMQAPSTYFRSATSSSSCSSFSKDGSSSLGEEITYPRFPLNELIADTFTGYRRAPEHIAPEVSLAGTKSTQDLYKQDAFSAGLVLDQVLNKRQHPYRATPDYMGRSTAGLSYDPYSPRVQRYKPYTLRQPAQKLDPKVRQEEQDADMLLMFLTHYNYTNRWSISRALDFVEGRPAHYF